MEAARTHFGTDPIGHQITGICPLCQRTHVGVCLDTYPPVLTTAALPFDLAVQLADGGRRLLIGDFVSLLPGAPVSVRRVEPTPASDIRPLDRVFYAHRYDPTICPIAFDPHGVGWGNVVRVRRRGIRTCISLRTDHGAWRYITEADPATLVLRLAPVAAR